MTEAIESWQRYSQHFFEPTKIPEDMAYFSNGSEGMVFDDQCSKCKYGKHPCPIAFVQMDANYDQHKDKSGTATKILNHLVKPDGTCVMWDTFKHDLEVDPAQLDLFEVKEVSNG